MHHDKILRRCWGYRINHPLLIAVLLLLFRLEGKKELHWDVNSWGLAQRGFNRQRFNSSLMPQPSDLFSATILFFAKFNMLTKLNPLLHEYWVNTWPHIIFQWNKGIVSPPIKYGGDLFLKKSYSWQMGEAICFGQIFEGALLQDGSMIRSCQGQGSFRNAISSNLKTINLKICPVK